MIQVAEPNKNTRRVDVAQQNVIFLNSFSTPRHFG